MERVRMNARKKSRVIDILFVFKNGQSSALNVLIWIYFERTIYCIYSWRMIFKCTLCMFLIAYCHRLRVFYFLALTEKWIFHVAIIIGQLQPAFLIQCEFNSQRPMISSRDMFWDLDEGHLLRNQATSHFLANQKGASWSPGLVNN